jgi:hypothetical protein
MAQDQPNWRVGGALRVSGISKRQIEFDRFLGRVYYLLVNLNLNLLPGKALLLRSAAVGF